jgi:hypothetical protein
MVVALPLTVRLLTPETMLVGWTASQNALLPDFAQYSMFPWTGQSTKDHSILTRAG